MRFSQQRIPRAKRRGSLYVPVMGVALIVSAIGMSAMMVARLNLRTVNARQDMRQARLLADSAVELAGTLIAQDSNWRTSYQNDTKYPATPLLVGDGTITWKLVDPDGNLADDETDSVRLYGIGTVGQYVYHTSVLLEPAGAALKCLEVAMHSATKVDFNSRTTNCDQTVSSNGDVNNNGSTVNSNVEAVSNISGSINGTTTSGVPARQMPNTTHVYDYYLNNGTWIDVNDLPMWGGNPTLQDQLLSPANNPYGSNQTNPEGIYVIDLEGGVLWMQRIRIVGTLVLLNAGDVEVYDEVNWEPAIANYPAMLVDGVLTFQINSANTFSESSVNLNPPGTPYNGEEDTDQDDNYPCIVKGLVYASGNVYVAWGLPAVEGVLVAGGDVHVDDDLDLTYDPVYLNNPPPGFRGASGVSGPEQQWLDQNTSNSGNGSNYTLGTNTGVGTYFAPTLPAEATSWAVTRVQIYANHANSTGTLDARVAKADGSQKPGVVLESVTVQETSLPDSFNWHEIPFSNASGLQPTESACVVFVANANAGARLKFGTGSSGSPGTHFVSTVDSGSSWTIDATQDLWIKIWGTYTTAGGSVVEISPGSWRREVSQ